MTTELTSEQIMKQEFLPVRAKILEIAATLDRLQRAEGNEASGKELSLLKSAVNILQEEDPGRAERVQMLFSLPYAENWRENFSLA